VALAGLPATLDRATSSHPVGVMSGQPASGQPVSRQPVRMVSGEPASGQPVSRRAASESPGPRAPEAHGVVGRATPVLGHRDRRGVGEGRPWRRISPNARRVIGYTVRPGDTPSGLAVRFHAWTAELVATNGSVIRAGERIRIPVVIRAAAQARQQKGTRTRPGRAAARPKAAKPSRAQAGPGKKHGKKRAEKPGKKHRNKAGKKRTGPRKAHPPGRGRSRSRPARAAHHDRATVRRVIVHTARRHGVDPQLALAVAWQESGWQQHVVSPAGAIGAMQVMPATGRWLSQLVGRPLHLRNLPANVTAGVVFLSWLEGQARPRIAIAAYYQGLAGVRDHGMYADTRRYVANVVALRRQFERGRYPA
jgi:soluble lytic murein transglycosylase-like protein